MTIHDHGDMLTFDRDVERFNFRVGAIIVHDGRLLLAGDRKYDFFFLPGGRVEWQEDSAESIEREILEELGVKPTCIRLAWIVENFFALDGKDFHEVSLCFDVVLPSHANFLQRNDDFLGAEEKGRWFFRWVSLKDLSKVRIVPDFIPKHLPLENSVPKHIVHRDARREP